jgi:ABC-type Fe3+ transport system permease subunit
MPNHSKIRKFENLHILFWLIKDLSWAMLWRPLGLIMIGPTVGVAIYILVKNWEDGTERSHNFAVLYWILANSFWMTAEFFGKEAWKSWTIIPFGMGLLILVFHYLKLFWKK